MNGFYSFPPLIAHLLELAVVALFLLIATGVGLRLLRLLRVYDALSLGERIVFGLALGLGALALLMMLMGLASIIYLPAGLLVLLALAGGSYKALRDMWLDLVVEIPSLFQGLRSQSNRIYALIILAAILVALIKALAPVGTQDDLMYHLALPWRYIEAHAITFYADSTYSGFPQLMEMLYTWGLLLGSDRVAVLLAFGIGLIGPATAAVFAQRYLSNLRPALWHTVPLLSTSIFLTIPLVSFVLRAANTDLAQASFDFLAVYAFWLALVRNRQATAENGIGNAQPSPFLFHMPLLVLSGLCCGLSFSTKYYGFAIAVCLLIALSGVIVYSKARMPGTYAPIAKSLLAFLVPFVALAAVWLVRNYVATGNPMWPLSGGFFQGQYIEGATPSQLPSTLLGSAPPISFDTPLTGLQFMWDAMTRGPALIDNQSHEVSLGFLVLPALLLLLIFRRRTPALWLAIFAVGYWLMWLLFFSHTSARYLSTFFLLCSVLGACGIVSLGTQSRQPAIKFLGGAITGTLLVWHLIQSAASLPYYLPTVFSLDPNAEQQYLSAYMEDYSMLQYIEQNTTPNAVIYVWDGQPRGYRIPRTYVYARLVPLYTRFGFPPEEWRARLRELGITHILTHDRLQLAPGQPPGDDPFQAEIDQFKAHYFGTELFHVGDYALYELK